MCPSANSCLEMPNDLFCHLNRAKLVTRIHEEEMKSQNYQVSRADGSCAPVKTPDRLSLSPGVCVVSLWPTDCHHRHRGQAAGGWKHRPCGDHWDRWREEANDSKGRHKHSFLQWGRCFLLRKTLSSVSLGGLHHLVAQKGMNCVCSTCMSEQRGLSRSCLSFKFGQVAARTLLGLALFVISLLKPCPSCSPPHPALLRLPLHGFKWFI